VRLKKNQKKSLTRKESETGEKTERNPLAKSKLWRRARTDRELGAQGKSMPGPEDKGVQKEERHGRKKDRKWAVGKGNKREHTGH